MVEEQILARGISDTAVIRAMREIPRHLFVPAPLINSAYGDFPLSIGQNQTISQPYIVAEMTQALHLHPEARVLEIGTGSGYQAAVLAVLANRVYTIERNKILYMQSRRLLAKMEYPNIFTRCSDGTLGWKEESPFDAIIVTAGGPKIPQVLLDQLVIGGYMVIPVGDQTSQSLLGLHKTKGGIVRKNLGDCRFVKLIGEHGWP